jgi:hypothetical protein
MILNFNIHTKDAEMFYFRAAVSGYLLLISAHKRTNQQTADTITPAREYVTDNTVGALTNN